MVDAAHAKPETPRMLGQQQMLCRSQEWRDAGPARYGRQPAVHCWRLFSLSCVAFAVGAACVASLRRRLRVSALPFGPQGAPLHRIYGDFLHVCISATDLYRSCRAQRLNLASVPARPGFVVQIRFLLPACRCSSVATLRLGWTAWR
jgi:hypothetical protein